MPNYRYNGIELPSLPDTHQYNTYNHAFEYACIIKSLHSNEITLHFFTDPLFKSYVNDALPDCIRPLPIDESCKTYGYTLNEDNQWEDYGGFINPDTIAANGMFIWGIGVNYEIIWCSHDIIDSENGDVYFQGSDPKPLPTPQDFYIVKNGVGQKQDVYLRVGGQWVKLDEYVT